jgi:hypothetical protein
MARSLKLSALVSLVAYAGGAAALLWRPRTGPFEPSGAGTTPEQARVREVPRRPASRRS